MRNASINWISNDGGWGREILTEKMFKRKKQQNLIIESSKLKKAILGSFLISALGDLVSSCSTFKIR